MSQLFLVVTHKIDVIYIHIWKPIIEDQVFLCYQMPILERIIYITGNYTWGLFVCLNPTRGQDAARLVTYIKIDKTLC